MGAAQPSAPMVEPGSNPSCRAGPGEASGRQSGPLKGYRVLEVAGIGPAPFCAMMLADMGADVVRIDRIGQVNLGVHNKPSLNLLNRGKRSVAIDLKTEAGSSAAMRLISKADALVEGFRPGVMERLGLGPDLCFQSNPKLVYGRVTGWGQQGPKAQAAGHDINYIALSGVLASIGRRGEKPVPPLNLIGDFGGGGAFLAFGIVCAMLEASRSGQGQVVDAAMVDGAASLMTYIFGLQAAGQWQAERGCNSLDSGAPFYDVYETRDGQYVALGSIETRFFREFLAFAGLDPALADRQWEREFWPELRALLEASFRTRTREEWCRLLEDTDACVSPVLSLSEAPDHPQNAERETFLELAGVRQPAPAPRFSRTAARLGRPPPLPGQHSGDVLQEAGFSEEERFALIDSGVVTLT